MHIILNSIAFELVSLVPAENKGTFEVTVSATAEIILHAILARKINHFNVYPQRDNKYIILVESSEIEKIF